MTQARQARHAPRVRSQTRPAAAAGPARKPAGWPPVLRRRAPRRRRQPGGATRGEVVSARLGVRWWPACHKAQHDVKPQGWCRPHAPRRTRSQGLLPRKPAVLVLQTGWQPRACRTATPPGWLASVRRTARRWWRRSRLETGESRAQAENEGVSVAWVSDGWMGACGGVKQHGVGKVPCSLDAMLFVKRLPAGWRPSKERACRTSCREPRSAQPRRWGHAGRTRAGRAAVGAGLAPNMAGDSARGAPGSTRHGDSAGLCPGLVDRRARVCCGTRFSRRVLRVQNW